MDKNPHYVLQPPGGGSAAAAAVDATDGTSASQGDDDQSQPSQWSWPFSSNLPEVFADCHPGHTEKLGDGTPLQMASTQLAKTGNVPGILQWGVEIGRAFEKQESTIKGLKRRIDLLEVPDDSAAYRGKIMEA